MHIYLSETRKLKKKLYRKRTDCMSLLHFHSHRPLSCKEVIIYSQALRYNMINSENDILQEELNNLTRILLAHIYPLSCKEVIIYSQALRYNMINSEDDILQEELNNLTRILLTHTYPLHLTIKKIKKSLDSQPQSLVIPRNTSTFCHYNSFLRYG